MKTIILAGGIGYRLKEETEFKPKPMVSVGNKPMLWHIMKIYAHHGFNEFIIALGYKGDMVKEYFLNQKHLIHDFTIDTKTGTAKIHKSNTKHIDNFKITFVDTGATTLPGERILKVKEYIPEKDTDFMVTYGDGVTDANIADIVAFHKKQKTIGTITGVHPHSKYGRITINKNGVVTEFTEKPVLNEWVNGGFMVFKKEFFDYLQPNEMEHAGLKRLVDKNQLSLFHHKGFWHSMDSYPDVDNLNKLWREGTPPWKLWKD